jgi:tRNA1(Val) A37 N6-methylase TrmN6
VNGSGSIATARSTDRVRVYRASADKLLGSLPDRSIDLVITDAPYTSVNRSPTSGHLRDWFADSLSWPQIGRVFAMARRKLKADGVLMAMTNNDGLREAIGALERAGFIGIRTITWDRQYPGLGGGLRHQCEFIIVGRLSGSRTLAGVDLVSVAAVGPGTAGRYPTAKPEGLGRELAAMAGIGRGSLVVDPFAGSGALLVGAAERGATVVAGDVSQRAVELASARLAQAGLGARRSSQRPAGGKPRSSSHPASLVQRPAGGKPTGTSRTTSGTSRRPASGKGATSGKPGSLVQRPANGKPASSHAPASLGRQGGKAR